MNTLELLSTNSLAYRKKLGITQVALAEKAGITKKHLLNIEKGRILPSAPIIDNLAKALGVKVGDLFQDPEDREQKARKLYETYEKAIGASMNGIHEELIRSLKETLKTE